jgi:tetratricopeptide (TPR) repeat protein
MGKLIQFPTAKSKPKNINPVINDEPEGFIDRGFELGEDWETELEFIEAGDWDGLIRYREQICQANSDDPFAEWMLGEAFILSEDYQRALDYLSKLHQKYPDFYDVQCSILDVLLELGKDENDFDWIEKPTVLSLTGEVVSYCYGYLKSKKKPRTIFEIYEQFLTVGYIKFDEVDLLEALKKDERFIITDDGDELTLKVSVKRSK